MIRPKCHSHSANLTDSHSANLTTPITREYQRLLTEIPLYKRAAFAARTSEKGNE
jgi:hypothetical protein